MQKNSLQAQPGMPRPVGVASSRGASFRFEGSREKLLGVGTIVLFMLVWAAVYASRVLPIWAFPSPWQVILAFRETIASGVLLQNTVASIERQITGVVLAAAVGVPVGLLLGANATARAAFLPLCRLLYPIPGIAWIPLAILWFGVGFTSTVFVIFFSGIWYVIFNTMTGVQTLPPQHVDVARVYLTPRWLYARRILIPGALPFIITGLRLSYGVGWRVIIGAEMISSIVGLGFLIDDARWQLRPDIMVCGMITIALIGWVSETLFFDWIERLTIERWGMKTA
jgi:ABC-type nitrate/sulfonate/bicarbonate transport system permease component